jgi:FkbM family methyltransferase
LEVETVAGRLLLHRDDEVITDNLIRWGVWEAAETNFVSETLRPGDTFVDVGANVGYFSVLAAGRVGDDGTVIALEPEPRNLQLLRANVARLAPGRVEIVDAAAYSRAGWLPFALNERNRGDHRLAPRGDGQLHVRCVRLDDCLPRRVDFVKIDTQGFDHDVIVGLTETIRSNPWLLILTELSLRELAARRLAPEEVIEQYRDLGLTISVLEQSGTPTEMSPGEVLEFSANARLDEVTLLLRR